jgi:hypothetical protein
MSLGYVLQLLLSEKSQSTNKSKAWKVEKNKQRFGFFGAIKIDVGLTKFKNNKILFH